MVAFALCSALAGWICGLVLMLSHAWHPVEVALFDRLTIATPPKQTLPITMVMVDQASVARLGPWPWPRDVHARLLDKLVQGGAAVVAFDLLFSEPGPAPGDEMFARAIRAAGAVVLARDSVYDETAAAPRWTPIEPLAQFTAAGAATGRRTLYPDRDDIVRLIPYGADTFWRRTIQALIEARPGVLPDPYVAPGSLMRHLGPAHTFPSVSYHQVLDGDPAIAQDFFADQIVLVGMDLDMPAGGAASPAGSFVTPFTRASGLRTPAVEIQATMIESALMGHAITRADARLAPLVLTGAMATLLVSLVFWKPVRSMVLFGLTAAAMAGVAAWLFTSFNLWVPAGAILVALLVAFVAMAVSWSWFGPRGPARETQGKPAQESARITVPPRL